MSADTYAGLEDAIRAHIADESPDSPVLTDWVLYAATAGSHPLATVYLDACSESPSHTLEGLLRRATRRIIERDDEPDSED